MDSDRDVTVIRALRPGEEDKVGNASVGNVGYLKWWVSNKLHNWYVATENVMLSMREMGNVFHLIDRDFFTSETIFLEVLRMGSSTSVQGTMLREGLDLALESKEEKDFTHFLFLVRNDLASLYRDKSKYKAATKLCQEVFHAMRHARDYDPTNAETIKAATLWFRSLV